MRGEDYLNDSPLPESKIWENILLEDDPRSTPLLLPVLNRVNSDHKSFQSLFSELREWDIFGLNVDMLVCCSCVRRSMGVTASHYCFVKMPYSRFPIFLIFYIFTLLNSKRKSMTCFFVLQIFTECPLCPKYCPISRDTTRNR